MSHFMQNDGVNLIFLDLEGKDLSSNVSKGNTLKKGFENKIRINEAIFEPGNAALLSGAEYSMNSGVAHKFIISGTDFTDDMSAQNSALIQELSNLATRKIPLDKATLSYCIFANEENEAVKEVEFNDAKIVACRRNGLHEFNLEIWAQTGFESSVDYDDEGATGSINKIPLVNLKTLAKE